MSELIELLEYTINEIGPEEPKYILESDNVAKAVKLMKENKTACLLVIDESINLKGIFTERDVLTKVVGDEDALYKPISEFMSVEPQTIKANDSVVIALQMMSNGKFRNIPVTNMEGKAVGIVTMADIMGFLTHHLRD